MWLSSCVVAVPWTSHCTDGRVTDHGGSRNVVFLFVYRVEYLEKSKHLQDQLRELRSEIEVLKVGEKQSELDHLHEEQVRLGETKYSTLRKVSVFPCLCLVNQFVIYQQHSKVYLTVVHCF